MEGKEDADIMKSRNGLKRTIRPYLAHLCSIQRGVVVVFLSSASDNVVIGTKLPASLPPILGHLLLCCENNIHAASSTCTSYSEGIAVSSQLRCCCIFPIPHGTCCICWPPRGPMAYSKGNATVSTGGCPSAVPAGLREDPNSDLPQE